MSSGARDLDHFFSSFAVGRDFPHHAHAKTDEDRQSSNVNTHRRVVVIMGFEGVWSGKRHDVLVRSIQASWRDSPDTEMAATRLGLAQQ